MINKAHEEALVNQELFQSCCNEARIDPPAMKTLAVKATKSTTWKKSTSTKDYKRMTITAASNYHPLSLLFKFSLETYGILAWWLHEFRTKYYLHHWELQADKTLRGSEVEPSTIVAAGSLSPLDSPLSNISGSMAHSQIDHLVREVLGRIFKYEPFSANLADQKPAAKSNRRAASNSSIPPDGLQGYTSPYFESLKESVVFFPGIIKTGMQPIHQDLHHIILTIKTLLVVTFWRKCLLDSMTPSLILNG